MGKTKKAIIAGVAAVAVIVAGATAYIQGKHYVTRQEVKEYLTQHEGYAEADIEDFDSFIANLPGDQNWMVSVGIKGKKGHLYYYYDRGEDTVKFDSYIVDGTEYTNLADVPK